MAFMFHFLVVHALWFPNMGLVIVNLTHIFQTTNQSSCWGTLGIATPCHMTLQVPPLEKQLAEAEARNLQLAADLAAAEADGVQVGPSPGFCW